MWVVYACLHCKCPTLINFALAHPIHLASLLFHRLAPVLAVPALVAGVWREGWGVSGGRGGVLVEGGVEC